MRWRSRIRSSARKALEVFIAWYPGSPLRIEAFEQAMAAWQSASNPDKADAISARLLQINPDNVRALANRAYVGRARAMAGDAAALAPAVGRRRAWTGGFAEVAAAVLARRADFLRQKMQIVAVFDGTLGFAALQAKQYDKARERFLKAIAIDPDNLADVYQLSGDDARAAAERCAGLLVCRARDRDRPCRAQRDRGRQYRQVCARPLRPLSRQ